MKISLVIVIAFCLGMLISGCTPKTEKVPVNVQTKVSDIVARPPVNAMVPAHKIVPLKIGDTDGQIFKKITYNNFYCIDDRNKLTTLQKYLLGIFKE